MIEGKFQDLNLSHEDIVKCVKWNKEAHFTVGERYQVIRQGKSERLFILDDNMEPRSYSSSIFRVLPRDQKTPRASISPNHSFEDPPADPKLLRHMSDAEIGALVRARNEGKVIEVWTEYREFHCWIAASPNWKPDRAYRVCPEPKPKTVTLYGRLSSLYAEFCSERLSGDTNSITYTLREDGKPDCASIRMEELTDAD